MLDGRAKTRERETMVGRNRVCVNVADSNQNFGTGQGVSGEDSVGRGMVEPQSEDRPMYPGVPRVWLTVGGLEAYGDVDSRRRHEKRSGSKLGSSEGSCRASPTRCKGGAGLSVSTAYSTKVRQVLAAGSCPDHHHLI